LILAGELRSQPIDLIDERDPVILEAPQVFDQRRLPPVPIGENDEGWWLLQASTDRV